MKIALKELRESYIALKILRQIKTVERKDQLDICIIECNELISIFVRSIQTAERNRQINKEK
jgi:DNA-directed RNA polymerase subunit K/omega